jgi:nucleoside-diphosphate-sugar epimerase
VTQALESKPLTIYGNGTQTRSFCYVDDLVEGIVRCAASDSTRGEIVNLGNPEEYTVEHFGEVIAQVAGVEFKTEYMPLPPDDPTRRRPDITKAETLLDWRPKTSLEDGIRSTLRYFRQLRLVAS